MMFLWFVFQNYVTLSSSRLLFEVQFLIYLFTQGESGVLLRLQIDIFGTPEEQILDQPAYTAGCQVKVFRVRFHSVLCNSSIFIDPHILFSCIILSYLLG